MQEIFQYILLIRQPVDYKEIKLHELLAITENNIQNVAIYTDSLQQSRAELLRRIEVNNGSLTADEDFAYTVTWDPSEEGPSVDVQWRAGRKVVI